MKAKPPNNSVSKLRRFHVFLFSDEFKLPTHHQHVAKIRGSTTQGNLLFFLGNYFFELFVNGFRLADRPKVFFDQVLDQPFFTLKLDGVDALNPKGVMV